jgi:hypothetical protein
MVFMNKNIIVLAALACCWVVFVTGNALGAGWTSGPAVGPNAPTVGTSELVFDPVDLDRSALPDLRDLPYPGSLSRGGTARRYTGIIKNKTGREVSVPSENSDATLVIPPHGWIEYTIWTRRANVTAYHDGKPFYCLKLNAQPREYPFMCSNYDFMAEIVKAEPAGGGKYKPMKKRKRLKKQQSDC